MSNWSWGVNWKRWALPLSVGWLFGWRWVQFGPFYLEYFKDDA